MGLLVNARQTVGTKKRATEWRSPACHPTLAMTAPAAEMYGQPAGRGDIPPDLLLRWMLWVLTGHMVEESEAAAQAAAPTAQGAPSESEKMLAEDADDAAASTSSESLRSQLAGLSPNGRGKSYFVLRVCKAYLALILIWTLARRSV